MGEVIAFGAGSAWVLSHAGVARLDAANGRVQGEIGLPHAVQLAFTAGHLWAESVVLGARGYRLSEVSPATDRVVRTVVVGSELQQGRGGNYQMLAAVGSHLYLETGAHSSRSQLFAVNAVTGRVLSARPGPGLPVFAEVGGTDVAVPLHGALAVRQAAGQIADSTVLGPNVWATTAVTVQPPAPGKTGTFAWRLDGYSAATGLRLPVVTPGTWLVAAGAGQLWGLEQGAIPGARPYLVEIDPSDGRVVWRYGLPPDGGGTNPALAVAAGAVWAVMPEAGTVYRVSRVEP